MQRHVLRRTKRLNESNSDTVICHRLPGHCGVLINGNCLPCSIIFPEIMAHIWIVIATVLALSFATPARAQTLGNHYRCEEDQTQFFLYANGTCTFRVYIPSVCMGKWETRINLWQLTNDTLLIQYEYEECRGFDKELLKRIYNVDKAPVWEVRRYKLRKDGSARWVSTSFGNKHYFHNKGRHPVCKYEIVTD